MNDTTDTLKTESLMLTTEIVMAYVSNNSIPFTEIATLITNVHTALTRLAGSTPAETKTGDKLTPAQVRKSMTPEALISFEDGKAYKTLRRHLTIRGLTPEAYRAKWGLPADYPMTSLSYSAQRSELAKNLGLGQMSRRFSARAAEDVQTLEKTAPAKRRGRRPGKAKVLAND